MIGTPLSNVVRQRPEHWKAIPAWAALRPVKEQGFPGLRLLSVYRDHGVIEKDSRDDNHNRAGEDLSVYQRVLVGDVVMNKMKAWQGSVAVSPHEGIVSPDYQVLRPRSPLLSGRFLHFLLRSAPYISEYARLAYGVRPDQWRLMYEEFRGIPLLVPSSEEQRTVVTFLDHKTAAIDALIAKKERLIELLQEKRQALITQAVTKGLDPNAPMKDSGIEWLGAIPAHWGVLPLRRILWRIEQGWSPESEDRLAEDGEWAVLKLSAVSRGRFRPKEHKALPSSTAPELRYQVRAGDLLVTRANTPPLVGDACFVESTPSHLMLPDLIYRLSLDERRAAPAFVAQVLLSAPLRGQITSDARGSSMTMAKVSGGHIRSWLIPLPSTLDEQRRVVEHVSNGCRHIDDTCQKVETVLDRLREYRQALISAAVTGKLDVTKERAA